MSGGARGSALVLALLVSFILSLLGISFLLISQSESLIAQNELRAAQALYVVESGAATVQAWFDRPGVAAGFPTPAEMDTIVRNERVIIDESAPYTATVTGPQYRASADDRLFRPPYRGSLEDAFLGREEGPDLRIDGRSPALLDRLSSLLFGDYPDGAAGVRARIRSIEVYAPPYVEEGGTWMRFGMATVKVVGGIYRENRTLAEQTLRVVLSEVPYRGPYGPLHSCADLDLTGPLNVHWGTVTAVGDVTRSGWGGAIFDADAVQTSVPRRPPPGPRVDLLWFPTTADLVAGYEEPLALTAVPDPWIRLVAGGAIEGQESTSDPQPFDVPAPPWTSCCDHSNLLQHQPLVVCPGYDYGIFKKIARSGGRGFRYFAWDPGVDAFRENGVGAASSLAELTDGASGLFFFDTRDGLPPADSDGNPGFDNLTPAVELSGDWRFSGFLYVNAEAVESTGVACDPLACGTTFNMPGEPYLDTGGDGRYDDGPDGWINLRYPNTVDGNPVFDMDDEWGDDPWVRRNTRGPDLPSAASFRGILYTSGTFHAEGEGRFYGTVIAREGVTLEGGPDLFWDGSILGEWPPEDLAIPRVFRSSWLQGP